MFVIVVSIAAVLHVKLFS